MRARLFLNSAGGGIVGGIAVAIHVKTLPDHRPLERLDLQHDGAVLKNANAAG